MMADVESKRGTGEATGLADVHRHHRVKCVTERVGRPKNREVSLNEIVVGVNGAIPLWAAGTRLYWRFNALSFAVAPNPEAARARIRSLLQRALDAWGDAAPVALVERETGIDFEIVLRNADDCDERGCVLASAFFPDAGRHELVIYPRMLMQEEQEQIETMIHELGHVFGLRHFFALANETRNPAQVFGTHVRFSIMNYGANSYLTDADRADLTALYEQARSGRLTAINGTPIVLVRPFSALFG
ncbi:MAG TPA: matrixin family metalloprotease [Allosphingosinicella sp.]